MFQTTIVTPGGLLKSTSTETLLIDTIVIFCKLQPMPLRDCCVSHQDKFIKDPEVTQVCPFLLRAPDGHCD